MDTGKISALEWLRYLIDHFLAPGALAGSARLRGFDRFTFDHHLDGLVIGHRRDNRMLFAICVQDNRVTERVLVPGDTECRCRPRLPYEERLDN